MDGVGGAPIALAALLRKKKEEMHVGQVQYSEKLIRKAGVYPFKITSIEDAEGEYGPQFKFVFKITSGRLAGEEIFGWASQNLSPKSKLMAWTKGLLPGVVIGPKFILDTDDLIDREGRLVLSVKPSKTTGEDGNVIDAILPLEDEEEEEAEEVIRPPRRAAKPF